MEEFKRSWLVRKRMMVSRIFIVILIGVLFSTHHSWEERGVFDVAIEVLGLLFVILGTFIRLYSALFIYGRKAHSLVTIGPYSVVRNPLYVGSFIATLGLGLKSQNLLFLGLIILLFVAYYPWVVFDEERRLLKLHGDEFRRYAAITPRFIPNLKLFSEPESHEVSTTKLKRAFLDSLGFLSVAAALSIIDGLRHSGIVPILLYLP